VSALVLAALVVMWAVVLVPMFLRRSERVHDLDGAARFAGAMRVLSRRRREPAVPADERRAAVISKALGAAPERPIRREVPPVVAARRRSARVAARRRGLGVMVGAMLLSLLLASVVGGWLWALQGAVDVFSIAGLLQIRASALADSAERGMPRAAPRVETRAVPEPAVPQPISARPAAALFTARPRRIAVAEPVAVPRPVVARPAAALVATMPADYYDAPAAPRRPDRVRRPLLDPVDTDPDTMTDGLELLDGILGRAAGQ
jgi:hypothetical protein